MASLTPALLLPLLLLVSGCAAPRASEAPPAPASTAPSRTAWVQSEPSANQESLYWASKDRVGITTYGGSGCPATPTTLERSGPNEIRIQWAPPTTLPCNADLRSVTFEAPLPVGVDTARPVTVTGAGFGTTAGDGPVVLPAQE